MSSTFSQTTYTYLSQGNQHNLITSKDMQVTLVNYHLLYIKRKICLPSVCKVSRTRYFSGTHIGRNGIFPDYCELRHNKMQTVACAYNEDSVRHNKMQTVACAYNKDSESSLYAHATVCILLCLRCWHTEETETLT